MAKFIVSALVLTFMAGCLQDETSLKTDIPESVGDGVLIHITSGPDEPLRALQALHMAKRMSERADVVVYADIDAVTIFLEDAEDLTHKDFLSSHALISELVGKGVRIVVCPGYLKAVGRSAEELMDGVELATPSGFFDFTKGRILSLDY